MALPKHQEEEQHVKNVFWSNEEQDWIFLSFTASADNPYEMKETKATGKESTNLLLR